MKGFQLFGAGIVITGVASVRLGLLGTKQVEAPVEYYGSTHLSTVIGDRIEFYDKNDKVFETRYSILFPIRLIPPEGYEFSNYPIFVKKD